MRLLISAAALAFAMFVGQPAKVEAAPVAPAQTGVEAATATLAETVHWRRHGWRHRYYAPRFYYGYSYGPAYYGHWRPRHYRSYSYYRPHYAYRHHYRRW